MSGKGRLPPAAFEAAWVCYRHKGVVGGARRSSACGPLSNWDARTDSVFDVTPRVVLPKEGGDLGGPRGGFPQSAIGLRLATDSVVAPPDQEDRRLDAGQVRRGARGYVGMRTFISVMPWIRFE
jgi:hypothetical protein